MRDFHEHVAVENLRRMKHLIDGLNGRAGNFGFIQNSEPRIIITTAENFGQ